MSVTYDIRYYYNGKIENINDLIEKVYKKIYHKKKDDGIGVEILQYGDLRFEFLNRPNKKIIDSFYRTKPSHPYQIILYFTYLNENGFCEYAKIENKRYEKELILGSYKVDYCEYIQNKITRERFIPIHTSKRKDMKPIESYKETILSTPYAPIESLVNGRKYKIVYRDVYFNFASNEEEINNAKMIFLDTKESRDMIINSKNEYNDLLQMYSKEIVFIRDIENGKYSIYTTEFYNYRTRYNINKVAMYTLGQPSDFIRTFGKYYINKKDFIRGLSDGCIKEKDKEEPLQTFYVTERPLPEWLIEDYNEQRRMEIMLDKL